MKTIKQTLLITGATSGIGRHAALHLAKKGHRVFAAGRNPQALEALRAEAAGLDLHALSLDVTDDASIRAAVVEVDRVTGGYGLDGLVNNAGFGMTVPVADLSDADLRAQFETNVFGLMAMTRAFLPAMRARRAGRIVNISSVGGRLTLPFLGGYNASKYAVESLSDALRRELRAFGIRVSLVEPGVIRTDFTRRSMDGMAAYRSADSDYAAVYERADELEKLSDKMASGPAVVTAAVESALLSRWPAARYVVPFSSKIFLAMAALMPTRMVDFVMRQMFGLTARRLRLTAHATVIQ